MKKVKFMLLLATVGLFASNSQAQGFGGSGSKYLQLGLGINQHYSMYSDYDRTYNTNYGAFNLQMEFGVHKYVGLGFMVGAQVAVRGSGYYYGGVYAPGYYAPSSSPYRHFGVPIGFIANFHFLQLIADKAGKDFANKIDVYGGLNIGSGPVFRSVREKYKDEVYYDSNVGALFFFGPHVGFRYFPSEKVGLYAEAGYGKSLITGGVIFKL
ncbi:MAG: hypothetical protein K0S23_2614 [Fluviicola sp.]|jgi:hypothetical protein|uniref:hypothetical protein n=1 Tax=Fluviicola sp. TaxID=1917219 RepID=UPI002605E22F|nr:hypothetical protein [Fluviicola sp.]MDF3028307.1 hypothetical protein [Fluviicola sp.]